MSRSWAQKPVHLAPHRIPGFTLIEFLIVMAIVAILLPLSAGSFERSLADLRSAAAMNHLASLFSYARHYALTHNRITTLCALNVEGRCVRNWRDNAHISVFIDANRNRRYDEGERLLRQIAWPLRDGELSWRASLARPYIEFQSLGNTWQNGTLYYCPASRDARYARSLVLSQSGRSYLPGDRNDDGIREDRLGRNLRCA